jgi:hypothetical protein
MTMDEMEDIVAKLDEGLAAVEARALRAEAELARVLSKQQSSADDDENDSECEICGSEEHSTDEHAEPDADDSASRQRDLNNGGKRKTTSKDYDPSGGDKEGRMPKSKCEKIVSKAAGGDYSISKCLSAVEKQNYREVTKRDFGDALDRLTHAYMAQRGKSDFSKSQSKVLATDEGSRLYRGYLEAGGTDVPEGVYDQDTRSLANRPPIDTDSGTPHQTSYKISKGLHVTRKEIEDSLDNLAASRVAKSSGSNFYTEYTKLLDDPVGKVLFNALDHILRYGEE